MNEIIYCYMYKNLGKDIYRSKVEELAYSKTQENVCYYDEISDRFLDKNDFPISIIGKRILMRTYIEDIDVILKAIEKNGGIPINSRQDINRILNWKKELFVNHNYMFVKGKEILECDEVKRKIIELSNGNEFFLKTLEKDFSGVIRIEELFDSNKGLLPALEFHLETDFIVSETLEILSDSYGKLEFRCFVVEGKIISISRNLFRTYHDIETKVWEQANNLLNRILKISDFPTTFCMDIMIVSSTKNPEIVTYDILELNPLEATGEYLYNTIWENSICHNKNLGTENQLLSYEDAKKLKMQDLVPIYKKGKILGFKEGLEPLIIMKQSYYKDEFSYHYGCAKKFGNPNVGRFWTHTLFSSGFGKKIDIIDILNDNICLKEVLSILSEKELEECGVDLEYMKQQIVLDESKQANLLEIKKV